jgi:hypothetical protein
MKKKKEKRNRSPATGWLLEESVGWLVQATLPFSNLPFR